MRQVKTAKGKILDMGALAKQYEETRAVGNVPMNGRGDRLDKKGGVKATVQAVARAAQDAKAAPEVAPVSNPKPTTRDADPIVTPEPEVSDNMVVSTEVKEREDGSRYEEIEYADGSMETRELDD
jgi:hypothetical protein